MVNEPRSFLAHGVCACVGEGKNAFGFSFVVFCCFHFDDDVTKEEIFRNTPVVLCSLEYCEAMNELLISQGVLDDILILK